MKETVNEICQAYGITKKRLAQILGVSREALYKWMEGAYMPNEANRSKLNKLMEASSRLPAEERKIMGALRDDTPFLDIISRSS